MGSAPFFAARRRSRGIVSAMRMLLVAVSLFAAITALDAAPTPKAATWADWAGSYSGSLTWSGCTVAGARTVALPIDFIDGVATIDLTPARPGLRSITLVEEDDKPGWSGRQGDVAVTLTRPRAGAIDLAIELDSGCLVRGRLTRASTGVAACDALIGWARVEASCSKQAARGEDVAKLLATKWKPADATSCAKRAATLERTLIDAGCAPHPDPKIGVRSPACLDLTQAAARISRCSSVLPRIKDAAVAAANAIASAAQTAEEATLPYVEQQCRDTRAELVAIATRFGCP